MINNLLSYLHTLRVLAYPSCDRQRLPKEPGLYYVVQGRRVIYVGLAGEKRSNLYARWNSYAPHKMQGQGVIHYRVMARHRLRYEEAVEIQRFNPPYNIVRHKPSTYRKLQNDLILLSFFIAAIVFIVL